MSAPRRLWTGPPGAVPRDRLLAELGTEPGSLWIVPTPLARDQVACELGLRMKSGGIAPQVYCWDDLWRLIHTAEENGPTWLSEPATRAVFREAATQVYNEGLIPAIDRVIDWPGYRRGLRNRIHAWTLAELPLRTDGVRSGAVDPIAAAEWTVFVRYRELLAQLKAEDDAGMSVWASKRLGARKRGRGCAALETGETMVFLDFEEPKPAHWRVLQHALSGDRPVQVSLTYDSAPGANEVYLATRVVRSRLLELGLVESEVRPDRGRPAGLCEIESALFRSGPQEQSTVSVTQGLAVLGAPQGEGVGRLLAGQVRRLRDRGVPPEEILVLFGDLNEQADLAAMTMRSWNIPAHADVPGSLRAEPTVSLLRLAARIPLEDWETELLVRLLRNGEVRPEWPQTDRRMLADAATVIKATPVFRGRPQLLTALDRAQEQAKGRDDEVEQIRLARKQVERLFGLLGPLDQPRPWSGQVDRLRQVARGLGLGDRAGTTLDPFWSSLEDHADVLDRLGRGDVLLTWHDFVDEIEAIVAETPIDPPRCPSGSIRVTTVDRAAGARADHVLLAGLEEGTFPARLTVEPFLAIGPGETPDHASQAAYGREMLRFLKVLASADAGLTLIYPTTDLKGQALLRAGFLDDLLGKLTAEAQAACHVAYSRFHPALLDPGELAGSAADLRVRAAALASERGETSEFSRLAGDPAHRPVLEGTVAALRALQRRLRGTPFSEFEGHLSDASAISAVQADFGASFPYSPSQLETYIACPFQFFSRYVLKLKPLQEQEELDEDYTELGSQIHEILENLEKLFSERGGQASCGELAQLAIDRVLGREPAGVSDLHLGLRVIERRRIERFIERYCQQRRDYAGTGGPGAIPHLFEVDFGTDESRFPTLEIGHGERSVRLRGRIDRVDLLNTAEGRLFRVIDYKTGSVPSTAEVKRGEMLQLLLYAMAVERHILRESVVAPAGVGYWALRKDGFKEISFPDWKKLQEEVESHVLGVADRLRSGVFVVDPRKEGCESYCDFRSVCRIRQVRLTGKNSGHDDDPQLSVQTRQGRSKRNGGQGSVENETNPADPAGAAPGSTS